jgi:hypothetical protein
MHFYLATADCVRNHIRRLLTGVFKIRRNSAKSMKLENESEVIH